MIAQPELKKEYGIIEFLNLFTEDYCREYLLDIVYPNGEIACPHCGSLKVYHCGLKSGFRTRCADKHCRRDFNIYEPTIFKNTKLPLRNWFLVIYQMSSNKKNTSSIQTSKDLNIRQATSWFLKTKIRYQLKQDDIMLKGIVEVDEAFVSKSKIFKYWGGLSTRKAPIIGLIERGGKVVVKKIKDRRKQSLIDPILQHVEIGSTVYTDGWAGYKEIEKHGFNHDFVEHSTRQWVNGNVHTNSIEGFWAFMKRNIRGAHHSVSDKHLQSYIDEAVFKFNNRHLSQMERFDLILKKCVTV